VENADEIFRRAEMIVKVKEPQGREIAKLKEGQIVFCYFHFAAAQTYTPSSITGVFGFTAGISFYFSLFLAAIAASRPLRASVSFGSSAKTLR